MKFYLHYRSNPFKEPKNYFVNKSNYELNKYKSKMKKVLVKHDRRINHKSIGLIGIKGLSTLYNFRYHDFLRQNFHKTSTAWWLKQNGHKRKINLIRWIKIVNAINMECRLIKAKKNVSTLIKSRYNKYVIIDGVQNFYHPRTKKFAKNARNKLAQLGNNKRYRFAGNYVRFGSKPNGQLTILLVNIFYKNTKVTNHLWFNATKQFRRLGNLEPGDIIEFSARVKRYKKGYLPHSFRKHYDYELSYPTNIRKIRI